MFLFSAVAVRILHCTVDRISLTDRGEERPVTT
jgi:hypothetical protein